MKKYKDIIAETPKGEPIPEEHTERIVSILVRCFPNIEKRIRMRERVVREKRKFGTSIIFDLKGEPKIKFETRSGLIVKAWVKENIIDENGMTGFDERSILNDSVLFRNDKKS